MDQSPADEAPDRGPGYERERARYFASRVHRIEPQPSAEQRALFQEMARAGGPLRTLGEVYLRWEEMLARPRQAVWLAIAGAYIPFCLGGVIRALMDHHLVDVLVTTPAQLTHDLTEVRGLYHYQGSEHVDDNALQRLDVNRYWNVFGDENELNSNEDVILDFAETLVDDRPYTASEYFYRLGKFLETRHHRGADGMLTCAGRHGVPHFSPHPAGGDVTTGPSPSRK